MIKFILLIGLYINTCTITSYRSISFQTDSSPNFTSTGERTHLGGVAVSRDLLCPICRTLHRRCGHKEYRNRLHYGDYVYIEQLGLFRINDVMGDTMYDRANHKRVFIRRHFDVWVGSLAEERKIKTQMQNVYVVKRTIK